MAGIPTDTEPPGRSCRSGTPWTKNWRRDQRLKIPGAPAGPAAAREDLAGGVWGSVSGPSETGRLRSGAGLIGIHVVDGGLLQVHLELRMSGERTMGRSWSVNNAAVTSFQTTALHGGRSTPGFVPEFVFAKKKGGGPPAARGAPVGGLEGGFVVDGSQRRRSRKGNQKSRRFGPLPALGGHRRRSSPTRPSSKTPDRDITKGEATRG